MNLDQRVITSPDSGWQLVENVKKMPQRADVI